MLKLDNSLLEELGLGSLAEDQKRQMLQHIYETLELRVGTQLANQMTDKQLEEFEKFIDAGGDANQAQALQWLEANLPNYKQVVQDTFESLKAEIKGMAPQLLASAQQTAVQAPAMPMQQPQPQPAPDQMANQMSQAPQYQAPAPQPMQQQPSMPTDQSMYAAPQPMTQTPQPMQPSAPQQAMPTDQQWQTQPSQPVQSSVPMPDPSFAAQPAMQQPAQFGQSQQQDFTQQPTQAAQQWQQPVTPQPATLVQPDPMTWQPPQPPQTPPAQ